MLEGIYHKIGVKRRNHFFEIISPSPSLYSLEKGGVECFQRKQVLRESNVMMPKAAALCLRPPECFFISLAKSGEWQGDEIP
jgi:hypothetical protein